MEYSENLNLYLPSRDTDDIVDVNQLSENFRKIDTAVDDGYTYKKLRVNNPIAQNSNLNDILYVGEYSANDTVANSLSNLPTKLGFRLTVINVLGDETHLTIGEYGYFLQIIRTRYGEEYIRRLRTGPNVTDVEFTDWEQVAFMSDLKEKADTVIGNKNQYMGFENDEAVASAITPDTTPTENSTKLITSGGVYATIGDVETALAQIISQQESIIAIQNKMMGIIKFIVGGNECEADEGMTWAEWCDSDYNMMGAYIDNGYLLVDEDYQVYAPNDIAQKGTDVIIDGVKYYYGGDYE